MDDIKDTLEEKVAKDREVLTPFLKYIPYFKEKSQVSTLYAGEGNTDSMSFPVYDSQFLSFVKEFRASEMVDKNYKYVYTRHLIKSHDDEDRIIKSATIKEWDILCGILSYYVCGGFTRPSVWNEGGKANVYGKCLEKMKEILAFYDISYGR